MNEHDFLQTASLNALLAAFANAKPYACGYIIESSYKSSKYEVNPLTEQMYQTNNMLLSQYTGLPFQLNKTKHQFVIQSTTRCDDFFAQIYRRIQQKRFETQISDNAFEDAILLSFFALRGSPDFKMNFYSLDLLRSVVSPKYLDNLFNLLTNLSDLRQLNLNFRELQEQFVSGENERNTQFRINLRYFNDRVGTQLAQINQYKADILQNNKAIIQDKSIVQKNSKTFVERIIFYTSKVLDQHKTKREIEQLRKELGFQYDNGIDARNKRNQGIVQYVRVYFPDECAACKQDYAIADRSFKYRQSDRYYMEVHHCISFSADSTCDQIDNLVKLCPACHRALSKNRADETYQRRLISQIFDNAPTAKAFCLNFVDNEQQAVDFVYERLR
ncbi:HNH endonuclease [Conchiformibius kuhniae]|uniref:HNH endonuclease n=1 Tax=Conchiformibius kuhniae TaxID=211502 RepID=A0A8T9MRG4_9NEIS|nr:HNH endonuclease [Conchiformibius kuhniae]